MFAQQLTGESGFSDLTRSDECHDRIVAQGFDELRFVMLSIQHKLDNLHSYCRISSLKVV